MHGDIPQANRDKLLDFLPKARHKLIRFLVLVRYLKLYQSRTKCLERVHEIINKSEHQYVTACHNFDTLYTEMVTTMEPAWDIESAIHCLTLGSYRNLPKIIDHSIAMDPHRKRKVLSPELVSSTMDRLNSALRVRLLGDDIPPQLKLLDIHKGMARMVATQQFEVSLSLRMRPKLMEDLQDRQRDAAELERERIRWSLFELKLLLKASTSINYNASNYKNGSNDSRSIVSDFETQALLLAVNERMKESTSPLQIMYQQLNAFCLQLQFAVFKRQIDVIRHTFGANNIRIEEKAKCITIRLWRFAADLPLDLLQRGSSSMSNNKNNYNDNGTSSEFQQSQQQREDGKSSQKGLGIKASIGGSHRGTRSRHYHEQQLLYQQQQLQLQSTNYSKRSRSIMGSSYRDTNTNTNFNLEVDEFERKENALKLQYKISLCILREEQGLALSYHPKFPSFITHGTVTDDSSDDTDSIGMDDNGKYNEHLDGDDPSHRGIGCLLKVDPSHLNLPALIGTFTVLHCNYRLIYVLGKLLEVDKEYHISPSVRVRNPIADSLHNKHNQESQRIDTLFSTKDHHHQHSVLDQRTKLKLMKHLGRKYIEICLCPGTEKRVQIYCNTDNGQMVIEKEYHEMVSTAPLGFEKNLKIYNIELNRDLSSISSIVKSLKIDCLLENVMDVVQLQLHFDVTSYAPCTKPSTYFVYPSSLMHHHRRPNQPQKSLKKSVTIKASTNDDSKSNSNSNSNSNESNLALPGLEENVNTKGDGSNSEWKMTGDSITMNQHNNNNNTMNDEYRVHVIQTYTQILNSWNERNSVFIRIPRFGKHCHLVIHFRSQTDAETYCIVCDHFGNLLYIHHIVPDGVTLPRCFSGNDSGINALWIQKYVAHCNALLPAHLLRIMVIAHTQCSMQHLLWREDTRSCTFQLVLPRPATTCNGMHIMPRQFDFEVALKSDHGNKGQNQSNSSSKESNESCLRWTCSVKQDHLFSRHRDSLLSKLGALFQFEDDALHFEFRDTLHLGQMTRICSYCFKLLVVHNILRGFLDHKQAVKQNSAFFPRHFYRLQRVDLFAPTTSMDIQFELYSKHEVGYHPLSVVLKLEIVWNEVENVAFYSDTAFNPFVPNPEYQIRISFRTQSGSAEIESESIYDRIPNLRLLIAHYFNYRQRYQRKLNLLLIGMTEDEDTAGGDMTFNAHDAMTCFKEYIGQSQGRNTNPAVHAKQQSYLDAQYESLSLLMLLQRLYWSIRTLNHLQPLLQCLNAMHRWYYPRTGPYITTTVTKHDTFRIRTNDENDEQQNDDGKCHGMNNMLAIRILSERRVSIHRIDALNGWQCALEHVEFTSLSQRILVHIQKELLSPRKHHFLWKMFTSKQGDGNYESYRDGSNRLMAIPPPQTAFEILRVGLHRRDKTDSRNRTFGIMMTLFNADAILENKLNFKQNTTGGATIYRYQQTLTHVLRNAILCPFVGRRDYKMDIELATTGNVEFVGNVMKAYFHLFVDMEQGYALYHEKKVHSFLSVAFLSAFNFIETNNNKLIKGVQMKSSLVSKALLSMQELFALLYDEMLQLSLFGGRIMHCIGANYFKKNRYAATIELNANNTRFWYNLHHVVDDDIIFQPRVCSQQQVAFREHVLCVQVHFAEIVPLEKTKSSLVYHSMNSGQRARSPSATISLTPSPEKSPSPSSGRGKAKTRGGRGGRSSNTFTTRTRGGKIKKRGGKFKNGTQRPITAKEEEEKKESKNIGNGHCEKKEKEEGIHSKNDMKSSGISNGKIECNDGVNGSGQSKSGIEVGGGKGDDDSKVDDSELWAFERYKLQNSLVLKFGLEMKEGGPYKFGNVFFYQTCGPRGRGGFRRIGIGFLPHLNQIVGSINAVLAKRGYPGGLLASFMRHFSISLTEIKRTDTKRFEKIWSELKQLVH